MSSAITLTGISEFQEITFSMETEILLMGTLKAAPSSPNPEDQRAPIDLCCVIDISGSMQGQKLDLVKQSLLFILQHLDPRDHLSIVLFDTDVETLLNFTPMTSEAKARATFLIGQIESRNSTNLAGGLLQGLELIGSRQEKNDVTSLLLFTDGMANHGITGIAGITGALEGKLQEQGGRTCSVFTFGFGANHDEEMLRAISEAGGGLYYHVLSEDLIPKGFADCLGGLQSVIGQNISLSLQSENASVILKSLNPRTKFSPGSPPLPADHASLLLGDMYSEEQRDVIFLVRLPALPQPQPEPSPCLHLTLTYFNVISGEDESATTTITLSRPDEIQGQPIPHAGLDEQRNRLIAADAIQQSRDAAERGRFDEAREVLSKAKEQIGRSSSSENSFCQKLVKDLGQCLDDVQNRSLYQLEGKKRMMRKAEAHYQQRSNRIVDQEEEFYETSSKARMKSAVSGF